MTKFMKYIYEGTNISAYWITNKGGVIPVNAEKHIDTIIQYPTKFGYTKEELENIYSKHNEIFGSESEKAREEIILGAIKRNFIRIRMYRQYISVNVYNYNSRTKKILSDWAYNLIDNNPKIDKFQDVRIVAMNGANPKSCELQELANGIEILDEIKLFEVLDMNKLDDYIDDELFYSLDNYGKDNKSWISEASLSRILSVYDNKDFAVMTAYRLRDDKDNLVSKSEKIKRNRELRTYLNSKKMGVHQLLGHFPESYDGKDIDVVERSYLIPKPDKMEFDEFKDIILTLVRKYDQQSALLKDSSGNIYSLEGNGEMFPIGKKLTLGKLGQYYSQYVRKLNVPFVFEGATVPNTNLGKLLWSKQGILWVTPRDEKGNII